MKLELIEKSDDGKKIKIGLIEADTTLITPILEKLDNRKDVKFVRFIETHPELDRPAIYVEMYENSTDTAAQAISAAAEELSVYYSQ